MIQRQIRKTRKPNRRKNVIELGLIKILITLEWYLLDHEQTLISILSRAGK